MSKDKDGGFVPMEEKQDARRNNETTKTATDSANSIGWLCPPRVKEALEEIGYIEIDGLWQAEGGNWDWWELIFHCLTAERDY